MNKRLLTVLCMIILIAVAMTAVVAVASASVDTLDYIYKGEYAHGIAGYSNDSVIVFGQANEIADEEYGIAIKEGESYKYFKADSVGTTGKFGIAFPAESIPDGEYKAYAYLKASNGDYVLGNEVDLVLNAGGDYTVNVVITDGIASWIAPAGTYSTVVKLNGVEQVVSGTSFDLSESQNYVDGTNLVEVECLTKSGYVYTGSATMNIVEINADNFADIDAYSENDYLVLTQDIDVTDYFSTFKDVYSTEMDVISATGILKSTFDGNGHKISYTHTRNADVYFAGVFAGISDTGVLKNTRFDLDVTDSGTNNTHPVAGTTFGKVKDCYIEMDVNGTNTSEKMSAFGSTYDKEGTSAASFENTIVNIPTLTTGGWINRAIGFGFIGVPSNWYEDVSVATQVSLKNVALISSQAFAPSYSKGNRDGVWVALSSEEFLDGNVWSLTNSDEYGWYSYSKSRSVQDTDYKGLKTNVSWTDSAWTKGVWDLSVNESVVAKTVSLKWYNQVVFSKTEQLIEMGSQATATGMEVTWENFGDKYDVYTKEGSGSEVLVAEDVTATSYALAKSAFADKDGVMTVKVVGKDSEGVEVATLSKDLTMVGSVETLKAVSTGTYVLTKDLTVGASDYATYSYNRNGVSATVDSLAYVLNGQFFGMGNKITSTGYDSIAQGRHANLGGIFVEIGDGSLVDGLMLDLTDVRIKDNYLVGAISFAHYGLLKNCYANISTYTDATFNSTSSGAGSSQGESTRLKNFCKVAVVGYTMTLDSYATLNGDIENCMATIRTKGAQTDYNGDTVNFGWAGYQPGVDPWYTTFTEAVANHTTITDCIIANDGEAFNAAKFSILKTLRTNVYLIRGGHIGNLLGSGTMYMSNNSWCGTLGSSAYISDCPSVNVQDVVTTSTWNNGVWSINATTGITLYGETVYSAN